MKDVNTIAKLIEERNRADVTYWTLGQFLILPLKLFLAQFFFKDKNVISITVNKDKWTSIYLKKVVFGSLRSDVI